MLDDVLYINTGVISNAVLLLREKTISTQRTMGTSSAENYDYDTSNIDTYLTVTHFNAFPQDIRNKLINTSITYTASDGTDLIQKTIQRKIFLPTYEQLNAGGDILSALKIYKNTDVNNTARIAVRSSTGLAVNWWTMSTNSLTSYCSISSAGGNSTASQSTGGVYVRPVISIDKTVMTTLANGVYICEF